MSIFSSWIKLLQLFLGIVQHHVAGGYGAFSQHRCVLSRLLQSLSWAKAGTPCPTHITPLQIASTILAQQQGMHMNHRTTKFPRPPSHWNFPLISVAELFGELTAPSSNWFSVRLYKIISCLHFASFTVNAVGFGLFTKSFCNYHFY